MDLLGALGSFDFDFAVSERLTLAPLVSSLGAFYLVASYCSFSLRYLSQSEFSIALNRSL